MFLSLGCLQALVLPHVEITSYQNKVVIFQLIIRHVLVLYGNIKFTKCFKKMFIKMKKAFNIQLGFFFNIKIVWIDTSTLCKFNIFLAFLLPNCVVHLDQQLNYIVELKGMGCLWMQINVINNSIALPKPRPSKCEN